MRKPCVDLFEGKWLMEKAEIQWDKGMPGLGIRLNRNGTMHYIGKVIADTFPLINQFMSVALCRWRCIGQV